VWIALFFAILKRHKGTENFSKERLGMIRAKLREKFGKNETNQTTGDGDQQPQDDPIPDETAEEIHQEDEDEGTSVCYPPWICVCSHSPRRLSALP
jgi:hypothetical protein